MMRQNDDDSLLKDVQVFVRTNNKADLDIDMRNGVLSLPVFHNVVVCPANSLTLDTGYSVRVNRPYLSGICRLEIPKQPEHVFIQCPQIVPTRECPLIFTCLNQGACDLHIPKNTLITIALHLLYQGNIDVDIIAPKMIDKTLELTNVNFSM